MSNVEQTIVDLTDRKSGRFHFKGGKYSMRLLNITGCPFVCVRNKHSVAFRVFAEGEENEDNESLEKLERDISDMLPYVEGDDAGRAWILYWDKSEKDRLSQWAEIIRQSGPTVILKHCDANQTILTVSSGDRDVIARSLK